jgi:hypothetical protein
MITVAPLPSLVLGLVPGLLPSAPALADDPLSILPQVRVSGSIHQPFALPTVCLSATHELDSQELLNAVLLQSSTLDLAPFTGGGLWTFEGTLLPVPCTLIEVHTVTPAVSTLTTCGTPVAGCPLRLRVGPEGTLQYWSLFVSSSAAFLPLDPLHDPLAGTLLLGEPVQFLSGGLGLDNTLDFTLPPLGGLVGVTFYSQALTAGFFGLLPFEPRLTNSLELTVSSFLVPSCSPLDC